MRLIPQFPLDRSIQVQNLNYMLHLKCRFQSAQNNSLQVYLLVCQTCCIEVHLTTCCKIFNQEM